MSHFAYRPLFQRIGIPALASVLFTVVAHCHCGLRGGRQADPDRDGRPGRRLRRRAWRDAGQRRHLAAAAAARLGGFGGSGRRHPDAGGCQQANTSSSPRSRPSTWWSIARAACSTASPRASLSAPTRPTRRGPQLKTAIQTVITQLDAQVRFGFTTIYGTNPSNNRRRNVPAHRRHARRQRRPGARTTRPTSRPNTTASRHVAEPERRHERGKEARVAGDVRDQGDHQGAHGRHDARATSTSSSSPTGRRTTATTRSRSARRTPPSARCRPRSPRTSGRSSSVFRRRSSICPAAVLDAFANAGAGEPTVPSVDGRSRYDRDLRSVPGRHALAHRPDRVGPPDHARTDGDGGDVRDDGGSDQALQAERRRSEHAGHAAVGGARGRQELHLRPQQHRRQDDQGRPNQLSKAYDQDRRDARCRSTRTAQRLEHDQPTTPLAAVRRPPATPGATRTTRTSTSTSPATSSSSDRRPDRVKRASRADRPYDSDPCPGDSERGANVGDDGAVTFSVWAPRRRALSVRILDPAGTTRAELPMARGDGGVFTARAERRRSPRSATTTRSCCRTSARAPIRCRATSRTACTARRGSSPRRRFAWTDAGWRGVRARRSRRLRAARRHVHARGHVRGRRRAAAAPARPRRHRRRADAGGGVPGRAQLGLRRRLPVRAARRLRRPRRPQAPGRRLPRARPRADPRRRLQPPRSGGELPRRLRPLLHRPLPHAVGRRPQLRRPGQRRGAALLRRQRAALADASTTSTGCGSTRSRASTTSRRGRSCRRSPTRSTPRRRGWAAPAWLIAESDLNDPRVIRPERGRRPGPGRAVERRLSPRAARHRHRQPARLLRRLRARRRRGQGDHGRLRLRRAARAPPPPPARRPAAVDAGRSLRGVHPEPRSGRQRVPGPAASAQVAGLARQKVAAVVLFSTPALPLLFQGEEWAEEAPFDYFTSHGDAALVEAVRKGRHEEYLHLLDEGADIAAWADPQDEETFRRCKLRWESIERAPHAEMLAFYRALIALRRRLAPLHNGRKDLTRVELDEAALAGDPSRRCRRRRHLHVRQPGRRAGADPLPPRGAGSWRSRPTRRWCPSAAGARAHASARRRDLRARRTPRDLRAASRATLTAGYRRRGAPARGLAPNMMLWLPYPAPKAPCSLNGLGGRGRTAWTAGSPSAPRSPDQRPSHPPMLRQLVHDASIEADHGPRVVQSREPRACLAGRST